MEMIDKSEQVIRKQERLFKKQEMGVPKQERQFTNRKRISLKIFSAKTIRFGHKLNGKIEVENVAYTLNFTYTETNCKL